MTAAQEAIELARHAAQAAYDKLATDLTCFDVAEQLSIAEIFLIVTVRNSRQADAAIDEIEKVVYQTMSRSARREGDQGAGWVLLDFGDVVVHIQSPDERQLFALDRLWADCPVIDLGIVEAPQTTES
jgi:ribosome-associated protein